LPIEERRHGLHAEHRPVSLDDGGKTLNLLPAPHAIITVSGSIRRSESHDHSNDGGATISVDGGKNWSTQYNQPTAQFITWRRTTIFSIKCTVRSRTTRPWYRQPHRRWLCRPPALVRCGRRESGYIAPDPRDSNIIYAGRRRCGHTADRRSNQEQDITVWPEDARATAWAI